MITYSILFYYILPLGLVVAGGLAAYLQGVHFRRMNRIRGTQEPAADSNRGWKRWIRWHRELPVGALIACSLVTTIAMMGVVEHNIDDGQARRTAFKISPQFVPLENAFGLTSNSGTLPQPSKPVYFIAAVREDQLLQLTGATPLHPSADALRETMRATLKSLAERENDPETSRATR